MPEIGKSEPKFFVTAMTSRLSLAAKLYLIFGLFAFLTAAITALSDYNTDRNTDLTEAVSTASRAALNVERINSLVYAVVMESRGVYMSTEPAVVKKYGEGLLKFNDRILEVVKHWQALVQVDDSEQFATFKKRIEQFIEFRKELVRRGVEINAAAGREWGDNDAEGVAHHRAGDKRARHLEAWGEAYGEGIGGVPRGVTDKAPSVRDTAETIAGVALDASGRAVAASGATEQASSNVSAVASAA